MSWVDTSVPLINPECINRQLTDTSNIVILALIDASQRMVSYMLYSNSKVIGHIIKNRENNRLPVATILVVAITSLLGVPHASQAACDIYYVSTTGNDTNLGTLDSPKRSIYQAATNLKPCDTLYVRGGLYKQYGIWIPVSGTQSQPIKILAYPGESPILDASETAVTQWDPFFCLSGNYIQLSGFELRNGGIGVDMWGHHNTVNSMMIHHVQQSGIRMFGDFSIAENNTVSYTCLDHFQHLDIRMWGSGIQATRDRVNGVTDNAIIRGNTVYSNWGEGIATFEANGTIVENNIAYDNWATNTYIDNATNVIFRNNLVYNTPNNVVKRNAALLTLADELASEASSANNVVINNMFLNGTVSAFSWTLVPGSGLTSTLIANNTIVNGSLETGKINQGSTIKNNIFYRNDGGIAATVPSRSGLNFSNNFWSSTAPSNASGVGDIIGDPKLVFTGDTGPGKLSKDYFSILSTPSAIGKGSAVLHATDFYLVTSLGNTLNIGAYKSTDLIQYVTVH
jgi:parallel beta-helix repeat protein